MTSLEQQLTAALQELVYETTHLSREEDDGSHWCKISKAALEQARAALDAAVSWLAEELEGRA